MKLLSLGAFLFACGLCVGGLMGVHAPLETSPACSPPAGIHAARPCAWEVAAPYWRVGDLVRQNVTSGSRGSRGDPDGPVGRIVSLRFIDVDSDQAVFRDGKWRRFWGFWEIDYRTSDGRLGGGVPDTYVRAATEEGRATFDREKGTRRRGRRRDPPVAISQEENDRRLERHRREFPRNRGGP